MRNLHSIANTGALFHRPTEKFLGSCFIFRDINTLLTAAHCVSGLQPKDLVLALYATASRAYQVIAIERHPTADVAVLKVDGVNERDIGWPKYSVFDDRSFGIEVSACGFPEDSLIDRVAPTARVFRGHVQRFFEWESHLEYQYLAAELSFRCPGGLSGGPLFNSEYSGRVYGLITENIRTSNVLDSIEEIQSDGTVCREYYESVIYYGIAVWLPALTDWLDSVVAPLSNDELARRGRLQQELNSIDQVSKDST